MKDLMMTFVLGSALSVLAGGAIADVDLHCSQSKCVYNEELGPSQTKTYNAYCSGYQNDPSNSTLYCHPVEGMTCTFIGFYQTHWTCTCTNWKTKEQHATIDLYCPGSK